MLNSLEYLIENISFPAISRNNIDTLQVNLGYMCNQQCTHCHVDAGPKRQEIMSKETVDAILFFIKENQISTLDLTGGAPEMNPNFKYLIENASPYIDKIIVRCNLTILTENGYEDYIGFFKRYNIEVVSSLPCYTQDNVDKQRGKGTFENSITAIRMLNDAGYGADNSNLILNLVYNPGGAFLPPEQSKLESDYKLSLLNDYNIVFNKLFTITNMPIKRFGSMLLSKNIFNEYMQTLKLSFNPSSMTSLMCRNIISIGWNGYLYDCDFNQMLNFRINDNSGNPLHISRTTINDIPELIHVAEHCYGCTAGQGSSCGGALT